MTLYNKNIIQNLMEGYVCNQLLRNEALVSNHCITNSCKVYHWQSGYSFPVQVSLAIFKLRKKNVQERLLSMFNTFPIMEKLFWWYVMQGVK